MNRSLSRAPTTSESITRSSYPEITLTRAGGRPSWDDNKLACDFYMDLRKKYENELSSKEAEIRDPDVKVEA